MYRTPKMYKDPIFAKKRRLIVFSKTYFENSFEVFALTFYQMQVLYSK